MYGMNDQTCSIYSKPVPKAALCGHMLERHNWSQEMLDEMLSAAGESKGSYREERIFGYRPFLIDSGDAFLWIKISILPLFGIGLYFSETLAIVILGIYLMFAFKLLSSCSADNNCSLVKDELLREHIMIIENEITAIKLGRSYDEP